MLPGVGPTWSCFSPRKIIPRYRCLDQGAKRLYLTVRIQATPSLILALVTSPDIFGCLDSVIKVSILEYRCRRWEWYVTANNRLLASWRDPTKRLSFPRLLFFTILFYFWEAILPRSAKGLPFSRAQSYYVITTITIATIHFTIFLSPILTDRKH